MAERNLLGIPLEKHRQFAFALHELHNFAQRPPAPRGMRKICEKLAYELDEHVFDEFKELPRLEKCHVYYSPDKPDFENSNFEHARSVLEELIATLRTADPHGKTLPLAVKLLELADNLALRQRDQETQGHRRWS